MNSGILYAGCALAIFFICALIEKVTKRSGKTFMSKGTAATFAIFWPLTIPSMLLYFMGYVVAKVLSLMYDRVSR